MFFSGSTKVNGWNLFPNIYNFKKLENALQLWMKQLAATLSRQRGVQYEFGPEYNDYMAKKAAGIL